MRSALQAHAFGQIVEIMTPDGTVLYLGQITYRGDFIQFEMQLTL